MEKISGKGVVYAVLPALLLLQFSCPVASVDIIIYEDPSQCSGSGYSFNSIAPLVCCEVNAQDGGSILVTNTNGRSEVSKFYRDGGCTTLVMSGNGDLCVVGGQFTGVLWYNARRRSLMSDSETCNSQMKPTGVVYSDYSAKGNWIVTTSEAAAIYSQMQSIPDAEKASWLESHGASYKEL